MKTDEAKRELSLQIAKLIAPHVKDALCAKAVDAYIPKVMELSDGLVEKIYDLKK